MKGLMPGGPSSSGASFTWPRALWTVILAAMAFGLYCLREYRILSEEQLMLFILVAVPAGAFVLSGMGQDTSDAAAERARNDKDDC